MSAPLSAIDTVSPAIQRTKQLLFSPFRFNVWWRLAVLGLFTGEISGGGNFHFPTNLNVPSSNKSRDSFLTDLPWDSIPHFWAWIALAVLISIILILIFMYISSILRFVLFDGVLSGRVRIREGWRRWRGRGRRLFVFHIAYSIISSLVFIILLGIPILIAWRRGIFHDPGNHIALLILGGIALFLFLLVIGIASVIFYVLTKDFVVPIMAFEDIGALDGWRRLLNLMHGNKGSYAGYLGFKLVLVIAVGMALLIIDLMVVFLIVFPITLVGVLIGLAAAGSGMAARAAIIALLVVIGVAVALALFAFLCLIAVPEVVFFQSYALHFFGSRYEPLRTVLYPPPPPPQIPPAPPLSPMPQPAM